MGRSRGYLVVDSDAKNRLVGARYFTIILGCAACMGPVFVPVMFQSVYAVGGPNYFTLYLVLSISGDSLSRICVGARMRKWSMVTATNVVLDSVVLLYRLRSEYDAR